MKNIDKLILFVIFLSTITNRHMDKHNRLWMTAGWEWRYY